MIFFIGRDPYVGMCHQAMLLMDKGIANGYLVRELDFKPDYDVLFGTPWSKMKKGDFKKMEEQEEEEMKKYMDGEEDKGEEGDTIAARFV